jgi:hypothetical protein
MSSNKHILIILPLILWIVGTSQSYTIRKRKKIILCENLNCNEILIDEELTQTITVHGFKRHGHHHHHHHHAQVKQDKENEIEAKDERHKREAPSNDSPDKDIQDIFKTMLTALVEGGKKMIKKIGEYIDQPPQQQGQQPTSQ